MLNKKEEILNKEFPISSICRKDLIEYIKEEKVLKLKNEEMKQIASKMSDYMQEDYWNALSEALNHLNIKTTT